MVHPSRRIRKSSLKPRARKRASTCRAWESRMPERTHMPPGRRARAKAGASSSRGRSSRLAKSRSALAWRNAGWARPYGLHHADARSNAVALEAFSIATATATGSMSLAITGPPRALAAAMARMPVPVPTSSTRAGRSALEQAIERDEAAARSGVMGGAEGKAGVDLKREAPRGHLAPVVTAMHQKAAGAHWPPQAFRLRHPILGGKLLDPGQR